MPDIMTNGASMPKEQQEKPQGIAEFEGYADCALFSEEVKITLTQDEVLVTALFDQLVIPLSEISSFAFENHRTVINTSTETVTFSRMGQEAEWLFDKLYSAYNDAVLKALLLEGEHLLEAEGDFVTEEDGECKQERGIIRLYDDCLCLLPPNENARRIPLCFVTGLEKSDFSRTLLLNAGERYTVSKMGRALDDFDRLLSEKLRELRLRTVDWHKELAPDISSFQAAASAKLMPLGTAAMLKDLTAVSPLIADSIEQKIGQSRISETYPWLKKLCGNNDFLIGAKPVPPCCEEDDSFSEDPQETEATETQPAAVFWVIAPDSEKKIAAAELALAKNEAAATYLYSISGGWDAFSMHLQRGLEASAFKRELITIPEEKLALYENRYSAMLIKRTPSLKLMRDRFVGRAIHSSEKRWRNDIEKSIACAPEKSVASADKKESKFCTNCGTKLFSEAKFCMQCGCKIN